MSNAALPLAAGETAANPFACAAAVKTVIQGSKTAAPCAIINLFGNRRGMAGINPPDCVSEVFEQVSWIKTNSGGAA